MAQETNSGMIRKTIIKYLNLLEENNISFEDVYLSNSHYENFFLF